MAASTAAAPAALVMSTGQRFVVPSAPPTECSAKAKTALNSQLQTAGETSPGTGQWIAYGPVDSSGHASAAAAIHCFPVGSGYVVTFTCAVEEPPNPYDADDLCTRLGASFKGKVTAPLATPTPVPTGCSTTNLVGTWLLNGDSATKFAFGLDGSVTDNQGVSGNWGLVGNTVTLTYYGTSTLKLSADGKRLTGPKSFTRVC
ncbi:MAG: hypothetical protein ABI231_06015 [Candidatus Tumulicola sp.]